MRRLAALGGALLAVVASGAPAGAATEYGYTCGAVVASTDTTTWNGVMWGGPWFVQPADDEVSMRCTLQQWVEGEGWRTIATAVSPRSPGGTVLAPKPLNVTTPVSGIGIGGGSQRLDDAPTNLQLCTEITIYRDPMQPPDVHQVDADGNPNNGAQCEKNAPDDEDLVYTAVFPPRVGGGRRCTFVNDIPDPLPSEYCVPSPV